MKEEKLVNSPFASDRSEGKQFVKEVETIKNIIPVEVKYGLIKETIITSVAIFCGTLIINKCLKIFGKNKFEVKVKTTENKKD